MQKYFAEMPWLAIPYQDPRIKKLEEDIKLVGIPSLAILKNGEFFLKDGSKDIRLL